MAKGTVTLYCIELDKASALLVSPLYEHIVSLSPALTPALGDQARQTLTAVGLPSTEPLYTLTEWHEWICSIEANLSSITAVNRLRALLGRTLFVQSRVEPQLQQCRAIQSIYGDNAPVPLLNHCLPIYLKRLDQLRSDTERARSLVAPFWDWVGQRDGEHLDHAVDSIFAYVKKGTAFPTLSSVVALLRRWKSAAKRLLCHKTIEMARAYTLHDITKSSSSSSSSSPGSASLAENGPAFRLFDIATCSPQFHLQACVLMPTLWQLLNTAQEKEEEVTVLIPPDLFFVEKQLARGRLGEAIHLFYRRCHQRFRLRCRLLRERLLEHLLLPLLCEKIEHHAMTAGLEYRGTIERVTPNLIHHVYQCLFGSSSSVESLDPGFVVSLAEEEEEEEEDDDDSVLFRFDLADFTRLLRLLHRFIASGKSLQKMQHKWILPTTTTATTTTQVDRYTAVFYIETQPTLLALERQTATLWRTHVIEAALSVELVGLADQPTMFNEYDERQQFRLMAFTPLRLRQCDDIAVMSRLVYDDAVNTVILREASTNHLFRERLARGFARDVTPQTWSRELYFESAHFELMDKRALKRTVIVADCHLLGADDMHKLLRWLVLNRETVRRVLLVGSFDMLPYAQNGQPFLDLALASEPRTVDRYLFAAEARLDDFRELLFAEDQWAIRAHTTHRSAVDDGGLATGILYQVDGGTKELLEMLEHAPDFRSSPQLRLHQLVRKDRWAGGGKPPKQRLAIEELPLQSKKQKQRILVENDMSIDALTRHVPARGTGHDVFVVTRKMLSLFNKNQLNLVFSALSTLVLVGGPTADEGTALRESIVAIFAKDHSPNLRRTSNSLY